MLCSFEQRIAVISCVWFCKPILQTILQNTKHPIRTQHISVNERVCFCKPILQLCYKNTNYPSRESNASRKPILQTILQNTKHPIRTQRIAVIERGFVVKNLHLSWPTRACAHESDFRFRPNLDWQVSLLTCLTCHCVKFLVYLTRDTPQWEIR